MAHGGTPEWNASVHSALADLPGTTPVAVAYGMANPYTLAASLDSLHREGADREGAVPDAVLRDAGAVAADGSP